MNQHRAWQTVCNCIGIWDANCCMRQWDRSIGRDFKVVMPDENANSAKISQLMDRMEELEKKFDRLLESVSG